MEISLDWFPGAWVGDEGADDLVGSRWREVDAQLLDGRLVETLVGDDPQQVLLPGLAERQAICGAMLA